MKYTEEDLEERKEKIRNCTNCRLSENRKNAVPGNGPLDADIMLIGEGPGKNEDEQGKPFVGKAGEKLAKCLEEAGLSREDVFITNVVKCRPPGNRDPKSDELEACDEHTKELIKIIDPKVIGLLGRIATKQLTSQNSITKARGKQIEVEGRTYIPAFHPAALVYDPTRREDLIKDLRSLREYVEMEEKSRQTRL